MAYLYLTSSTLHYTGVYEHVNQHEENVPRHHFRDKMFLFGAFELNRYKVRLTLYRWLKDNNLLPYSLATILSWIYIITQSMVWTRTEVSVGRRDVVVCCCSCSLTVVYPRFRWMDDLDGLWCIQRNRPKRDRELMSHSSGNTCVTDAVVCKSISLSSK